MKDLLALATIRRLLLELGAPLGPEVDGTLVGPLERWMHEPREDLGGAAPLHVLSAPEGVNQVRQCLRRMISLSEQPIEKDAGGPPTAISES
jgi:hypothetical protein